MAAKGKGGNTVTTVWGIAEPIAQSLGLKLWDVRFEKEGANWYLRVFIDSEEGVTIDQCEGVSRELDPILDEEDPIPDSYIFEVSSAGLERTLKRPSDFERFIDSLVEVKLYKAKEGRKEHVGRLKAYDEGAVEIEVAGNTIRFEKNEVANVRLRVEIGG